MKKIVKIFILLMISNSCLAQFPSSYFYNISMADSLTNVKSYKISAEKYIEAFKENNWKGRGTDFYNLACVYALANIADSAFLNLDKTVHSYNYTNYNHISKDKDLIGLHKDKRWLSLLDEVLKNNKKAEATLNQILVARLDTVFSNDQGLRQQIDSIYKKFGDTSDEYSYLMKEIRQKDSINTIIVSSLLDKYGWLGNEVVGDKGTTAIFLVIQHSNKKLQEKYVPLMRRAVIEGKIAGANLALLEDRLALRNDKKQIYGSQVRRNAVNGKPEFFDIEDEVNVNERRASVGLEPLEFYAKRFGFNYKLPVN